MTALAHPFRWRVSLITKPPAKVIDFACAPYAATAEKRVDEEHEIRETLRDRLVAIREDWGDRWSPSIRHLLPREGYSAAAPDCRPCALRTAPLYRPGPTAPSFSAMPRRVVVTYYLVVSPARLCVPDACPRRVPEAHAQCLLPSSSG